MFFRTTTPLQRPTDVFKAKCLTNRAILFQWSLHMEHPDHLCWGEAIFLPVWCWTKISYCFITKPKKIWVMSTSTTTTTKYMYNYLSSAICEPVKMSSFIMMQIKKNWERKSEKSFSFLLLNISYPSKILTSNHIKNTPYFYNHKATTIYEYFF